MSDSKLVSYVNWSPNNSGPRSHKIDRITPHCVVGQCSIEALGDLFSHEWRQASSNYGIGTDGRVGLFVTEAYRSWCSSSPENDNRAVTIECASDNYAPYAFNATVYAKLIELCTDICKRNGKKKLLWLGHCNYEPKADEMLLTVHRWFDATFCPGDWLMARMGDLATQVTKKLQGAKPEPTGPVFSYQVWTDLKKVWLPNVKNATDYAGIYGEDVDAVLISCSKGNVSYGVHTWKGDKTEKYPDSKWLKERKNRSHYAGKANRPIDAIYIKSDTPAKYRVHLRKENKWLPWVKTKDANKKDGAKGYAGIIGSPIDAIQIKPI